MSTNIQCGWITDEQLARSLTIALRVMTGAIFASGTYVSQFGLPGWFISSFSLTGIPLPLAVSAAAGAAATLGFVAGYCAARHFGRLTLHRADVCLAGLVDEVHQDDRFYISWLLDPDLTFNLIIQEKYKSFVVDNAGYVRCTSNGMPYIHCEIVSSIQTTACIGGVMGAIVGAVLGTALGMLAGAAIASLSCGIFAFLCFLLALIVAFVVAAATTAAGSYFGGLAGVAVGKAIDATNGLLDLGDSISIGDCLTVEGDWITDNDHDWNEIHPVKTMKLAGKISGQKPFSTSLANSCPDDCPRTPPVIG